MMTDLIEHIANTNGLEAPLASKAFGILLNSADRQGAPLAEAVFRSIPGTRALSAQVGAEIGAPTGEIARLIERTPGGRRCVVEDMFSALLDAGLGHDGLARMLPVIGAWMKDTYGIEGMGTLSAIIAHDGETAAAAAARAA
ncbi:hypothetical protein K1X12_16300 [Hyphomonas sp. WL0036]|uniref:hypothetical protein n=1 Tax=Hyphomonas sediminis TaxID=2866160 RepID=UPI001C809D56|nr:hypothetical protein [Hyphomonas sediminis]MBY9068464.1 hypothetical protein [Hyphomonas sediminis]